MGQVVRCGVLGAWFGHEGVALGAAFEDSWFFAAGTAGDFVLGDAGEHVGGAGAGGAGARGGPDGPL